MKQCKGKPAGNNQLVTLLHCLPMAFWSKCTYSGWNVYSSISFCASVFWESKLAYELWHLQWRIKHWHIVIWEVMVWH